MDAATANRRDDWAYWSLARWAFLVFNATSVPVLTCRSEAGGANLGVTTVLVRAAIAAQALVALLTPLAALRRRAAGDDGDPVILAEVWTYLAMAAICCCAMASPLF